MEIPVNTHGSTKVVVLPSAVDGEAVTQVETVLRQLIAEEFRHIVCNFSQTDSVSDAGLAMFINVLKDLHRVQGQMVFCLLKPALREVFSAAGLTNLYHYYEQDEALQADILAQTGCGRFQPMNTPIAMKSGSGATSTGFSSKFSWSLTEIKECGKSNKASTKSNATWRIGSPAAKY